MPPWTAPAPSTPSSVLPLTLMTWATESWVSTFFERSGLKPSAIYSMDPDQPISELGSRMLHLAAMCPDRASKRITLDVMRYLLVERGASPNLGDQYGRTPLTFFVTQAGSHWCNDPAFGLDVLTLMFDHGANANVLFAPGFMSIAGCHRWTLAHHLSYDDYPKWPMPAAMRALLDQHLDVTIPDSEGRLPKVRQIALF